MNDLKFAHGSRGPVMAGATNLFENDLLALILTNVALPNMGDTAGLQPAAAAGSLYISAHTGSLLDTHTDQTQFEAAYTGYARVGVARSAAEWTVTAGVGDNDNAITFPASSSGPESLVDFGIGFSGSLVAGSLQMFGTLDAPLVVNNLITPEFAAGQLDITID